MCRFSVSLINYALKTQRGYEEVTRIANNFCAIAHIESPLVCSQVSRLFNHEVTKVLSYGIVTPNQICGYLSNNTCGHFHNPLDEWEINLDAGSHLNQVEITKRRLESEQMKEVIDPYKVLHISDTHVDLNYLEGSPAVCEEPSCCQRTSTPSNKSQAQAGFWGTYGVCDIPLRTFDVALKAINDTIDKSGNIDYIIWTGDIQPHDVWAQSKKSANKIYDTLFGKIFQYLPNIKILPTFGNHEMIPVDSFSPSNLLMIARDDSPEWLYRKLDSFWSRWLPSDTIATITKDGFYSVAIRKGLRVISLNTNFCHTRNFWLYINSTDPGNQLQWLVHELHLSELMNERVHIIGHIPPGADDCLKVWSKNYNKILRRFSNTITGQFFGHTHNNEFEVFYNYPEAKSAGSPDKGKTINATQFKSWTPLSVGFIGPSITTFIDLNPSFRVYDVDPAQGFMPTDFETYFMNLTFANMENSVKPTWTSAGKFSQKFNLKDASPQSIHDLLVDIAKGIKLERNLTATEEDRLYELYRLFNSYSDKFTRQDYDKIPMSAKAKFVCKYFTGQAHDSRACDHFIHRDTDSYSDNLVP